MPHLRVHICASYPPVVVIRVGRQEIPDNLNKIKQNNNLLRFGRKSYIYLLEFSNADVILAKSAPSF